MNSKLTIIDLIADATGKRPEIAGNSIIYNGSLDLRGTGITQLPDINRIIPAECRARIRLAELPLLIWNVRGRIFLKIDGIFSELISHHGKVWQVREIGKNKMQYVVTDGEGNFSHGNSLDEAKKDLAYKICNREKSEYEALTLSSELSYQEAVECYRVITGACAAGTRNFCENLLPEKSRKDKYTIGEIIELTKGHYGCETFRKFFTEKQSRQE